VNARRGQLDHVVARPHGRAVDQPVALDDADACGREVELVLAVDTRQLAVSPPISATPAARQTSAAPSTSSATCSEIDMIRDVIEQDERVGTAGDHVVDAVRRHVGAACAQRSSVAGDHRLRPD
jgi:hypothetical protein